MRAIVLVLCLASAGGIAVFAHYTSGETGEPVYTVPTRVPDPAPKPPAPAAPRPIDPADRAALTRGLQRELKRVGCYSGEITGVWTTSSRMAMKAFNERVNATLPIDNPDPVLLSLVQGYQERACGAACPAGQTAAGGGACVPTAVLAKVPNMEDKSETDKPGAALPAAGAAAALAAAATVTKADPKAPASADAVRAGAGAQNGPVPPEGTRERRPRRSAEAPARPPKVVRDFLRALGFK